MRHRIDLSYQGIERACRQVERQQSRELKRNFGKRRFLWLRLPRRRQAD